MHGVTIFDLSKLGGVDWIIANEYQGPFIRLSKAGWSARSDIIIYCDQTRLQQNTEGHWVDVIKDILMHVKLINKQTVREESKVQVVSYCEDQEGSTTYYAWTHVLSEDGTAVIQLCPWYMKLCLKKFEAGQPVYITPDALNSVRDLATRPSKLLDQPSQIDYFCLLDCVILHEVCIT
jgi:hypothetical protein